MKSFLVSVFFLVSVISGIHQSQSKTQQSSETVYITETGARYHKENCHYLKYSKIETTKKKAEESHYTPCKVCFRTTATSTGQPTKGYPATNSRCQATTQKGTQCKRTASSGSKYCWQHQ